MLKNPYHIYGQKSRCVPANLNFGEYILDKIWSCKNETAMVNASTNETVTYGEMAQQAINFAVSLTKMGVRKGDVVALFSENRQEYFSAIIGVVSTGAVLTPFSTAYAKGEIQQVMSISKPKYIICSPKMYKNNERTLKSLKHVKSIVVFGNERLNNTLLYNDLSISSNGYVNDVIFEDFVCADVEGQTDTLFIVYSSGTTGLPKGVMLSHLNVLIACTLKPTHNARDATFTITPWYHVMGLVGVLGALVLGRLTIYIPKFEVDLYLKTIEKYKVAQLTVVPPVLVAVTKAQNKYDLSSVKVIYSGAAPLHKDTIQAVFEKFPNVSAVFQGYGTSETTLGIIRYNYDEFDPQKIGSVGKVVAGNIVKVVDIETRQPLGPNKTGEICVKGGLIMKGYVGRNLNEETDSEGFYKTGDVGYYDNDHFFYICDRLKELIKYKGHQVPPAELEAVLLQHEGVKDAGVVGLPHKESGEVPLAFVVPQPGKVVTEQSIKDFIAERLSNPKHLRGGVRFIEQIPKSTSGKILRKELRKMLKSEKSKL